MADKRISDLPVAGALSGTELVEVVQSGANVQTTVSAIDGLATAHIPISSVDTITSLTETISSTNYQLIAKSTPPGNTGKDFAFLNLQADATNDISNVILYAGSSAENGSNNRITLSNASASQDIVIQNQSSTGFGNSYVSSTTNTTGGWQLEGSNSGNTIQAIAVGQATSTTATISLQSQTGSGSTANPIFYVNADATSGGYFRFENFLNPTTYDLNLYIKSTTPANNPSGDFGFSATGFALAADVTNKRLYQWSSGTSWNLIHFGTSATTGTTTGFTQGTVTSAVQPASTFTGNTGSTAYTIGDIVKALKNCGALAA